MEGQITIGVTCHECRVQFKDAGAPPPCDVDVCKYNPSPGDCGPKGCGLAADNDGALHLWHRYKTFGDLAMSLVDMELEPHDADQMLEKLMLIEEYAPKIADAQQRRTANRGAGGRQKRSGRRRGRR